MSDQEQQLLASLHAWSKVLDRLNYYALLGIARNASAQEVRLAFHRFALSFHPDRYRDFSEALEQLSQKIFVRGVEAYKVLRDARARSDYDMKLAQGQLRAGVAAPAPPKAPLPMMSQAAPRAAQVQSLVDLCRSPAARLCAMNADRSISEGDLRGARKLLLEAISKDGGNPQLQARLDALDFALDAMG
ncbi:MAG TPA: J domain-containing protein [Polyangiaceae bacterium]|nr:J domain-containing protein [Polyangiaceae bacterium]